MTIPSVRPPFSWTKITSPKNYVALCRMLQKCTGFEDPTCTKMTVLKNPSNIDFNLDDIVKIQSINHASIPIPQKIGYMILYMFSLG